MADAVLPDQFADLQTVDTPDGTEYKLTASIKPEAARRIQDQALKQNIVTLHNRINELGVAEPVIQQQGIDRIVVQLPGVQDTAKAKDILGRTATLEFRMVNEDTGALESALESAIARGGVHTGDVIAARHPGGSCPRCGAEMRHGTVGGRSTWWCSREQVPTTVRYIDL